MKLQIPKIFKREPVSLPAGATKEAGVSGDEVFGTFDKELERSGRVSIKDYRKMRNTDGTVESLYNLITLPIIANTYSVTAHEEDEAEEQAEFIRSCLFKQPYLGGMETPFSLVLEQMLHALVDGFEVFERVYKFDDQGRIVLKKLALRDATTIKIRVDSNGGYDGIRQEARFGGRAVNVVIPASKTFLFTYGKSDNQWYGRSAFASCWRNYDKKIKLEYLDGLAIQNAAVKPKILKRISDAVIKSAGDDKNRKDALRALSTLGTLRPVASIPAGFDVDELTGGDNSHINESIERQNSEMARALLASFSLLGSQGTTSGGSYALSSNQSEFFMAALNGIMRLIEAHINQYWIADLIDLNFPVGKRFYPEFHFDDITNASAEFLKESFTKLIEHDRLSEDVAKGIEDKVANRFGIEREEETAVVPETTEETSAVEAHAECCHCHDEGKEEEGFIADGFRREPNDFERKVNFKGIKKQQEKIESAFEKNANDLLGAYLEKVVRNPESKIELPEEYIELVKNTYKKSYNYGKMSASDEEKKAAPKTTASENEHTKAYVDFVVKKQVEAIENMIAEQKMKLPLNQEKVAEDAVLTSLLRTAALALLPQMVNGTKQTIFTQGMNAGREDAYAEFDANSEDVVYMWSALLENSCPVCQNLDQSTYTEKQRARLPYQPGQVHIGCNCIWVRMTGPDKPRATGRPENADRINYIQTVPKDTLIENGDIAEDQTKKDALRALEYNNTDNGKTLDEVSDNIRNRRTEYLAVFDKDGRKIIDYTSGEDAAISVRDLDDYVSFIKSHGGVISVHNHPRGSSFSDTDIANNDGLLEMRVVSRNMTYSLKVGEQGWPEARDVYDYYEEQYEKYDRQAKIKVKDGSLNGAEQFRWIIDKTVESVAKKFGLTYTKRSVK